MLYDVCKLKEKTTMKSDKHSQIPGKPSQKLKFLEILKNIRNTVRTPLHYYLAWTPDMVGRVFGRSNNKKQLKSNFYVLQFL